MFPMYLLNVDKWQVIIIFVVNLGLHVITMSNVYSFTLLTANLFSFKMTKPIYLENIYPQTLKYKNIPHISMTSSKSNAPTIQAFIKTVKKAWSSYLHR